MIGVKQMTEFVGVRRDGDREAEIYGFYDLARPFPDHFHDAPLFGCLLRGKRMLMIKGKEIMLSCGQLVYVPPFMPHSCRSIGGETVDWICMQIRFSGTFTLPGQAAVIADGRLAAKLRTAVFNPQYAGKIGSELLKEILARQGGKSPNESSAHAAPPMPAGADKYKYLRMFRKTMGITPGRYGESLRINRAKNLIKAGLPLVEAAMDFCDQSHLNRAFKKTLGVTPGAWKQAYVRSARQ